MEHLCQSLNQTPTDYPLHFNMEVRAVEDLKKKKTIKNTHTQRPTDFKGLTVIKEILIKPIQMEQLVHHGIQC